MSSGRTLAGHANAAQSGLEPDFASLGPATRLAIRTGLMACDDAIREHEAKLSLSSVAGPERRHLERELRDWIDARTKILTQDYPPPYKPGQRTNGHHGDVDGEKVSRLADTR